MSSAQPPTDDLAEALREAHPELEAVRAAAREPVYLVGGAVRDLLLGRPRADVDLLVEGDAAALAERLGGEIAAHRRFGTAKVRLGGHEVDIATARTESYPAPGALPVVEPAANVESDLGRRDFTINSMAIPLDEPSRLIDPQGGRADLDRKLLRVLHLRSFVDDPTRALRAARYAARFGFSPEPETERLLRKADLEAVSEDRRWAELERLAAEANAVEGLRLLADWGLIEPARNGLTLADEVLRLLSAPPWEGAVPRAEAVLAAALGTAADGAGLSRTTPKRPSEAVEAARDRSPMELLLARAAGAEWLDRYMREWRHVSLEIDGGDLLAAGVPRGPELGRGLRRALAAKLDGEALGREEELAAALEAARS